MNRRDFLKLGLGSALLSSPILYNFKDIFQSKFQLGREELIDPNSMFLDYCSDFRSDILTLKNQLNLGLLSKKVFGTPIKSHNIENYCLKAKSFLDNHNEISNILPKKDFSLVLVENNGSRYDHDSNNLCFLVDRTFIELDIEFVGKKESFFKKYQYEFPGSFHELIVERVPSVKIENSYMVVSSIQDYYLMSFFSEALPYLLSESIISHRINSNDALETSLVTEAITESLSYTLAKELNKNSSENLRILEKNYNIMVKNKPYQYVRNGVSLIEKIGMKNSLELYLESPIKYFEKVKSI